MTDRLQVSDLVGFPWAEAEPLLRAAGIICQVRLTGPPRGNGTGELMVVQERQLAEGRLLVLARRTRHRASRGDLADGDPLA